MGEGPGGVDRAGVGAGGLCQAVQEYWEVTQLTPLINTTIFFLKKLLVTQGFFERLQLGPRHRAG